MPSNTHNAALLVGRILLALIFVLAGFAKIGGFDGTAGYIASKGLPMPQVVAALTIALEIVAGLAIVIGFQTRPAALALAAFTLLAAFIFHAFWTYPEAQRMMQQQSFMKNLAIVGGLLALAVAGPGRWSIGSDRSAAT